MNGINADNILSDIYSIILSFNDTNRIPSSSLLAFKKSLKWIDLHKRDVLDHTCKLL